MTRAARSLFDPEGRARVATAVTVGGLRVLVALDVDGTLAPIVSKPDRARVPAATLRLLARAARLPGVTVAVVSARSARDLKRLVPVAGIRVAAQYGLEGVVAPAAARRRRWRRDAARIATYLAPVAAAVPGARIEAKSLTAGLHDRAVSSRRLPALGGSLRRVAAAAARLGFVPVRGRRVTEFVPRGYDKGRAVTQLRRRYSPRTVFYFGDSEADERAFAVLGPDYFPVRVGPARSRARYRVREPGDVARFLRLLLSLRTGRSDKQPGGAG